MYQVILSAYGNIDHNENPYSNVVNGNSIPIIKTVVDTIEDCQNLVRTYIDEFDLGAGNWTGGAVYDENGYVGKVSYNGRFWGKDTEYGHLKGDK